jgi:hydroxymethylpyrimidine/phosphomethylpyrimidine kinase
MNTPKTLTIAGSDSSGQAGIAADLRTFTNLKVHGSAILTAITAQNAKTVNAIFNIPLPILSAQLETTLKEIRFDSVKTGMLSNVKIIDTISRKLKKYKVKNLVIDPVMTSTSGKTLLEKSAVQTLIKKLFPLSTLITPNLPEAGKLTGIKITTAADIKTACKKINKLGAKNILIKGGHVNLDKCSDVLYCAEKFYFFALPRIKTKNTRGTGCMLSAAIAAYLARNFELPSACMKAKKYVARIIKAKTKSFPIEF